MHTISVSSLSPHVTSSMFSPSASTPLLSQMKTPTRRFSSSPASLASDGSPLTVFFSKSSRSCETSAAALDASTTVSGMSLGSRKAPATNIPGTDVSVGQNSSVRQKLYSFNFMPSLLAVSLTPSGGVNPSESIAISNSSCSSSPVPSPYVIESRLLC